MIVYFTYSIYKKYRTHQRCVYCVYTDVEIFILLLEGEKTNVNGKEMRQKYDVSASHSDFGTECAVRRNPMIARRRCETTYYYSLLL